MYRLITQIYLSKESIVLLSIDQKFGDLNTENVRGK